MGDPNNYRYLVGDLAHRDAELSQATQGALLLGFQFASEVDRDDRTKPLAAVIGNGALLECVSRRPQADVEIVHAAMQSNIRAIRWADPRLKRAWRMGRKYGRQNAPFNGRQDLESAVD